ncbi:MAG TPA: patatin-like phospholipase family protein [Acidimicrobiales bacterium]|nr:patatin-like phospholipase family protein [Acidimicrobiales bacterium]
MEPSADDAGAGQATTGSGDGTDDAGAAPGSTPEARDPDGWTERLRMRWAARREARRFGTNVHVGPAHRTAFVLAGGGSRGAVQVGMLAELVDRNIRADRVFGASVGAINGASYAGNPTAEGTERMAEIWRNITGDDIFPRGAFDGPWAFLQKREAVHSNRGLRKIIEQGIDFENLEDATIPFEVVTTSLTDGRERWIGHGNAVEAILASSAIPSIFPPVVIDDDTLVDGGVVNNVPISRAIAAGCTRIYVLLCGPLHFRPKQPKRPAEAALTAFFVAIHARFVRELALLPPGVEVVVFSGGGEPSAQYRDFSATATLIEEGRQEVADVLDRYAGTSHDLSGPDERDDGRGGPRLRRPGQPITS